MNGSSESFIMGILSKRHYDGANLSQEMDQRL